MSQSNIDVSISYIIILEKVIYEFFIIFFFKKKKVSSSVFSTIWKIVSIKNKLEELHNFLINNFNSIRGIFHSELLEIIQCFSTTLEKLDEILGDYKKIIVKTKIAR